MLGAGTSLMIQAVSTPVLALLFLGSCFCPAASGLFLIPTPIAIHARP
jgi:hypothetical protein